MRYQYQALDGQQQEVSGVLDAANEREAARQLKRRDLILLQLKTDNRAPAAHSSNAQSKPKRRDILMILHELSTLLESGVSLIEAVESLAESSHHPFLTQQFASIATQLRHGTSFSAALKVSELQLPLYLTQLLEAGEMTGQVAQALRDGVQQMEYDAKIADEMRNAMIYPSILVISGIAAVILIFILVVPRFANILKSRGDADIPFLAEAVIGTGMFLNNNLLWVITAALGLLMLGVHLARQAELRARVQDEISRLPLIGEWLLEAETGRWSAMMGTLLENRVPLLRALELAQHSIKLPSLYAKLTQVSKAVRAGTPLSKALQDNDAMSVTGHNLIRAGERAGELPRMLKSLARLFEESGRVRMKRLLLLIEPAAILLIGGAIGVIITGVILAITSVNQVSI